jgi:hypothetical protein
MNPDKALDIIYNDELPLRVGFKQNPIETIEFVNNHLMKHADVNQTFSAFYKYSYLIYARDSKMNCMKAATNPNLHNQFLKLLDHNQRCMLGASMACMDAMTNYDKHQRVSSAAASGLNLSWFDRHTPFGSHAQYVEMKNVPAGVYLFMVAFTFALLQYEIMFNARCVALVANRNPSVVSVPATITMENKEFDAVFVNGIGEWLKGEHSLGEYADDPTMIIPSFMQEIGTNALLDKQFARTIDPRLQQQFLERQSQNQMAPTSTGGRRGHVSKRRNKGANTRARRMRRTNKRLLSF